MNSFYPIFFLLLTILNVVTFTIYGWDKHKAKKQKWRVPEKTLLLLAFVGGALGALIAIRVFHHKTLHKKFKYGVPLFLILHIMLLIALMSDKSIF